MYLQINYICEKIMGILIGIDFGQKRTGIAITDPGKIIASGLATVPTKDVMTFLEEYVLKQPVDKFVVGEPKQKDGSVSVVEKSILKFIKKLKNKFADISIERYDERFTSRIAFNTLLECGVGKKKRQNKSLVDQISATLILQSYLESQSNKLI
jgi:putative Holliday junction resolvase|tara:strand:- start:56 stop:517 length:462 start_codon:yes stop_codon:yes gene_type:complete